MNRLAAVLIGGPSATGKSTLVDVPAVQACPWTEEADPEGSGGDHGAAAMVRAAM